MKHIYYIGLGSNLGDSRKNIEKACDRIETQIGKILKRSAFYESEPWGFEARSNFVNAVISCESDIEPLRVMQELLHIENQLGRERSGSGQYESRKIDLDIIAIGEEILETKTLVVPHPQMHLRAFVLAPLLEIEPNWRHPLTGRGIKEILEELEDTAGTRRLDD